MVALLYLEVRAVDIRKINKTEKLPYAIMEPQCVFYGEEKLSRPGCSKHLFRRI